MCVGEQRVFSEDHNLEYIHDDSIVGKRSVAEFVRRPSVWGCIVQQETIEMAVATYFSEH